MCGIIGAFNIDFDIKEGLEKIKHRGLDSSNILSLTKGNLGHCLHAINDKVEQPLKQKKEIFLTNCEIYNFKELNKKYEISGNDANTLFYLVKNNKLSQADGVYAYAYFNGKKLELNRDIIGVKPIWYYYDPKSGGFAFASEKKALKQLQETHIRELNPRQKIIYDVSTKKIVFENKKYFQIKEREYVEEKLQKHLDEAITKRISNKKTGLLLSGGVDSSYIALKLKQKGVDFIAYVAGLKEEGLKDSEDIQKAKQLAKKLNIKLKVIQISLKQAQENLKEVLPIIEDNNVVKAGVALPFYLCAKKAKEDGVKIMFSGLGSEEIFAGYQRHKQTTDVNKECLAGLRKIYEKDLYRDDVVMMSQTIELRLPFLDKKLVKYALTIPSNLKIQEYTKQVFREVAYKEGLPKEFAFRKKKAAQYGSNFDKSIAKLAKKQKLTKSQYLEKLYSNKNLRLASLMSTGKDSALATQIMIDQNYEISCFITIISQSKDSYMYHGPNTWIAKKISQLSNIPIIIAQTIGEKEKELQDLKKAIQKAISKYKIEGIVTGALYSDYQRKRVEKICEELGIKCFSPLWHMNQEEELQLLLKKGFKFCMVKIAAYGLDKTWLGKPITQKEIQKLKYLEKKYKINIAGEGGEYESLILKAPFMKEEIKIKAFTIHQENEYAATMLIEEIK